MGNARVHAEVAPGSQNYSFRMNFGSACISLEFDFVFAVCQSNYGMFVTGVTALYCMIDMYFEGNLHL